MTFKCFECGDDGHASRDCPNREALDQRPLWCGECDQRTRHLELPGGRARRCRCHPLAHELLKQHKRCPICRQVVVIWDESRDCTRHILGGIIRPYVGTPAMTMTEFRRRNGLPPRTEEELRTMAEEQVRESRAARLADLLPAGPGGMEPTSGP